ncbi:hypothetical protein [Dickeya sp. NCPPB 3274]|uniref:H-NS family histone-like protein n=1 Tax=Dickeya sp. NCPPB 3274 TaxID=568766 RepID=UPI00039C5382|nr:hypothetical protein [Dickeya sp. NCPPB 3274]
MKINTEEIFDFMGKSKNRKQWFNSLSSELIESIINEAVKILDDVREREKKQEEDKQRRMKIIKETASVLVQEGLTVDDLKREMTPRKSPTIEPRQYQIGDKIISYAGAGRMNKELRRIVETQGPDSLEKYRIK